MGKRDAVSSEGSSGEPMAALLSQPRARRLNPDARKRLQQAARDATLLYPDKPDLQQCAIVAALDYLHHTADLHAEGAEWHRIREEAKRLEARVRQLAVMSIADKTISERRAASLIFVDRMALRRWSGKTSHAGRTPIKASQR